MSWIGGKGSWEGEGPLQLSEEEEEIFIPDLLGGGDHSHTLEEKNSKQEGRKNQKRKIPPTCERKSRKTLMSHIAA